jgi:heme A synthase
MHSHLVLLLTFAFFVSLVFALLSRDSPREQVRFGALLMGGFLAAGIVLGWLMYAFPL